MLSIVEEKNGMCILNGTQVIRISILLLTESFVIAEHQHSFGKVELANDFVVLVTSSIKQPTGIFRHSFLKAYPKVTVRIFLTKIITTSIPWYLFSRQLVKQAVL